MDTDVHTLADRLVQLLEDRGYSRSSVAAHRRCLRRFEEYCAQVGASTVDRRLVADYLRDRRLDEVVLPGSARLCRTAVLRMVDLAERGSFPGAYHLERIELPDCFVDVHAAYAGLLACEPIKPRTAEAKLIRLKKFLCFLAGDGVRDVRSLTVGGVYRYLSSLAGVAPSTRAGIMFALREQLGYLVDRWGADRALAGLFPVILVDKDAVLPSVYTGEEVARLVAVAGRGRRSPLRDRAVVLLAALLGMRAGDIRSLRLDQIDWRLGRVSFTQRKTGAAVSLPLVDEAKFALLDYLANERPASGAPEVFVLPRAPFTAYGAGNSFHYVIRACFDAAGVETAGKHRGLHSMRHSAAVGMLSAGVPYPVISGVLGHASPETTMRYLRFDVAQLRRLSLEVPA
ncbi:MAG: tyrosine-type recombinase/integrase [Bifidobacteriaceae bacterium]|jgi:integrase|nr:tyrosine-type recombinase/integrase [Bifidobacteriaceae bacterium]